MQLYFQHPILQKSLFLINTKKTSKHSIPPKQHYPSINIAMIESNTSPSPTKHTTHTKHSKSPKTHPKHHQTILIFRDSTVIRGNGADHGNHPKRANEREYFISHVCGLWRGGYQRSPFIWPRLNSISVAYRDPII